MWTYRACMSMYEGCVSMDVWVKYRCNMGGCGWHMFKKFVATREQAQSLGYDCIAKKHVVYAIRIE